MRCRLCSQVGVTVQEYVSTLQQTAAEQERELSKLRGEKEEAERVSVATKVVYTVFSRPPCCLSAMLSTLSSVYTQHHWFLSDGRYSCACSENRPEAIRKLRGD